MATAALINYADTYMPHTQLDHINSQVVQGKLAYSQLKRLLVWMQLSHCVMATLSGGRIFSVPQKGMSESDDISVGYIPRKF
jgi:hypothetical protein